MLLNCCTQYAGNLETPQWPQDWKWSIFIPVTKKVSAREYSNYCTVACISHTSKVMLKILQSRLQQYVKQELPDVPDGFRKGRRTRDTLPTSIGSQEKQDYSIKASTSGLLTMLKPLTLWIKTHCGKFLEMEIPEHHTCLLRNLYTSQEATIRTGHGTTDWFQMGKGVHQGCILSPCLFNLCAEYIM